MKQKKAIQDIEYKASWIELFYDLVFVALVAQLTYFFSKYHYSLQDFINTFLIGYMIFQAWFSITANRNLKQRDDFIDIIFIQGAMVFAMIMSLTLPLAFHGYTYGYVFFLAYGAIRLIGLKMIWHYYKEFPEKAPKTKNIFWGFFIANIIWVIAGFTPSPYMYIIALSALSLDILTPKTKGKGNKITKMNMHHLTERFGLLLLMVMGESVLVVALANTAVGSFTLRNTLFVIAGIVQMIALWWLYFPYIEKMVVGIRARHFQTMIQSHILLLGSLVSLATGLKLLMQYPDSSLTEEMIFIGGLLGIIITFNLIRWSLTHTTRQSLKTIGGYSLGIICITGTYYIFQIPNIGFVIASTVWLILYTAYDYKKHFGNKCGMRC